MVAPLVHGDAGDAPVKVEWWAGAKGQARVVTVVVMPRIRAYQIGKTIAHAPHTDAPMMVHVEKSRDAQDLPPKSSARQLQRAPLTLKYYLQPQTSLFCRT